MRAANLSRKHLAIVAACAIVVGQVEIAQAHKYWVGPTGGLWSDPNNWSATPGGPGGAGVPQPGEAAVAPSGISARFDYVYTQFGLGLSSLSSPVLIEQDDPASVMMGGGLQLPQFEPFPGSGIGRYNQTAGTAIIRTNLYLGQGSEQTNRQGFYTLSGNATLSLALPFGELQVQNGLYTQTGGFCQIAGHAELGNGINGKPGGIDMSGGTLNISVAIAQLVGASTFSGGHTNISGFLGTGLGPGEGVTLSGGSLSAGSVAIIAAVGGSNRMVQNGGTLLAKNELIVVETATYRYNGGSLSAGSLDIAGQFIMSPGADKVARTRGIVTSGNGKVNIADNAATVDYEAGNSPIDSIRSQIVSGFNNGSWNGNGINSSSAAANPGHGVGYAEASELFTSFPAGFRGVEVDETTLLIAYARYGDANLDGVVNLSDFNRLAANFGGTNVTWSQGDFNYDGMSNLSDFNLLAANFGLSASPDGPTPEDWATLAAVIPEPSALLLSGVAASAVMVRPRRRGIRQLPAAL